MKKMIRTFFPIVTAVVLLVMTSIPAAAKELTYLDISGPGVDGTQTLQDPTGDGGYMRKLESTGFLGESTFTKPPPDLSAGYAITAYLNLDGKTVPFVRMEYFRGAKGQTSYLHYTGRYDGTSLKPVDEWTVMNADAEIALNALAEGNGITLQPAVVAAAAAGAGAVAVDADSQAPARAPVASSATTSAAEPPAPNLAYPLMAIVAALGAVAAASWIVTSRRARRHAAQTGDD